jgi:regulator of sirC expression with transglutaminase-like and TPR domain
VQPRDAREELLQLLSASSQESEPFPLDRAGLLLAVDEYPYLPFAHYEAQLDEYAARTRQYLDGVSDPTEPRAQLGALRRLLFEEEAFHGNREQYYDIRNSYLNEVLDRKLGIPISLGAVMIGVARRLGWSLEPVNFPNHFLLRLAVPDDVLAVDPFHGGLILGPEELEERWRQATGLPAPSREALLRAAPPSAVVVRMLNNIWMVHAQARRFPLAALAKEKIALIEPHQAAHDRDLGLLWAGAGDAERAARYLERYLERSPSAPDRDAVVTHLRHLRASGGAPEPPFAD